jgi:hypothetical protein
MSDIYIRKHTNEEVNLLHIGKLKNNNETVAIIGLEDTTVWVMPLEEFTEQYEQHEFSPHDEFSLHE